MEYVEKKSLNFELMFFSSYFFLFWKGQDMLLRSYVYILSFFYTKYKKDGFSITQFLLKLVTGY